MHPSLPCCVILAPDADESLRSLLSDVLSDMGIALRPWGGAERPDVVLALVQREDSVSRVLEVAGNEAGPAPVFALLPFEDERLRRLAMSLGAQGCYALGTPLESLKGLLRNVADAWRTRGERGEAR
ncbi:DNA-binding response regulator [Archangium violaceum]|uniref:DNA-binding response regulator n=1 Tax=Archangium violaceum TaxID=83451 RepID=UPI00193C7C51|nr:DNA-binding response regulator [Archangium violaceum]QRK10754.1 DNA-binding response regulator [Archangium violaceum]